MITTPENLHTDNEFINSLGLSVEAREVLYILDNRHSFPLSRIVGKSLNLINFGRIEVHAEIVRESFSKRVMGLLQINKAFEGPNRALQTSYQRTIRSMLSSPIRDECDRMTRLLWNQFDREKPPLRALGTPLVLGTGQ